MSHRINAERQAAHEDAVVWIGINDVCMPLRSDDPTEGLDGILSECYDLGLRNLVLIDVHPARRLSLATRVRPVHRIRLTDAAPSAIQRLTDNVKRWNDSLPEHIDAWISREGTTAKLFSAHRVFSPLLEAPEDFGFKASDPNTQGGGIWADHVHPRSKVHQILAGALQHELR